MNLISKMFVRILVIVFFMIVSMSEGNAQNLQQVSASGRTRGNFDSSWQFHKGDIAMKLVVRVGQGGITDINVPIIQKKDTVIDYTNFRSSSSILPADWKTINLPHDWCIEGTFVHDDDSGSQPGGNGYLPVGIGFYRKEFEIPESDKGRKISIEFDGIFRNSTVWVNGHLLGNHPSGYTPSNYDLTDVLRYGNEGRNVILVKVDATQPEGWWYEGCGIYRHIWLTKTNRLHVTRFGTYVTTPTVSEVEATVSIRTTLKNEYKAGKN